MAAAAPAPRSANAASSNTRCPFPSFSHAAARILLHAWGRIDGARLPSYGTLVTLISDKYGPEGAHANDVVEYVGDPSARRAEPAKLVPDETELRDYFLLPKLKCTRIDSINTLFGTQRDALCWVTLSHSQWTAFESFFARNPQAVLGPNDLSQSFADVARTANRPALELAFIVDAVQSLGGNVCIHNSWTTDGGDNGRFYMESLHDVGFVDPQMYDVTWAESDIHPDLVARRQLPFLERIHLNAGHLILEDPHANIAAGMHRCTLDGQSCVVMRIEASRLRPPPPHINVLRVLGYFDVPLASPPDGVPATAATFIDVVMERPDGDVKTLKPADRAGRLLLLHDVAAALALLEQQGLVGVDTDFILRVGAVWKVCSIAPQSGAAAAQVDTSTAALLVALELTDLLPNNSEPRCQPRWQDVVRWTASALQSEFANELVEVDQTMKQWFHVMSDAAAQHPRRAYGGDVSRMVKGLVQKLQQQLNATTPSETPIPLDGPARQLPECSDWSGRAAALPPSLVAVFSFVLLLIASVLLPRDVDAIEPVTVAKQPISVWSVRSHGGDFMLSTSRDEVSRVVASGWAVEIPAGDVSGPFQLAADGGAPLYRCWSWRAHFFTTDATCKGHTNEGHLGYVRPTPSAAFPRLLRVCYKWGWQHYHALGAPCHSGDMDGGALGYVA